MVFRGSIGDVVFRVHEKLETVNVDGTEVGANLVVARAVIADPKYVGQILRQVDPTRVETRRRDAQGVQRV